MNKFFIAFALLSTIFLKVQAESSDNRILVVSEHESNFYVMQDCSFIVEIKGEFFKIDRMGKLDDVNITVTDGDPSYKYIDSSLSRSIWED